MANRGLGSVLRWVAMLAGAVALAAIAFVVYTRFIRPVVSVTRVVEGPVVQAFYATGTVSPEREFPIRSNVAGIITEMRVDKGDRVAKDRVLATVLDDQLQFKLRQAEAEAEEKRALADEKSSPAIAEFDARIEAMAEILAVAQREHERLTVMLRSSTASPQDLDRSLDRLKNASKDFESTKAARAARLLELQKNLRIAEAALEIARWNFDQQTLRSPIDGAVLDRPTSRGTRVAVNDLLMTVADIAPQRLVMRAAVDEEDRGRLEQGQRVTMSLYSFEGQPFTGRVAKIYDQAESTRRTFEVDVTFDADPNVAKLAPGMTGELTFIERAKERAPIIPAQAVQDGAVWVVRDGTLMKSQAVVGLRDVERAEVTDGLQAGDLVVISPVAKLGEGKSVRTTFVDPLEAASLNAPDEKVTRAMKFN